ncbi:hypothetical protein AL755_14930 [Arthrobacter sp. ERGS1:01]|uniref:hypothetical protein n=1 Tax=Arthrobacter sp. ERGS1:01 TaxID=1704044 RepID=UPI0006B45167|nr:hypothetical protein [Arthrobacter sp. ERGS1:01]ALE06451.1 hypothetical protein AL755_14930 [Arthrobacter sp. ERGS1:01]
MPGPLLHVGATVMCAHGGQAQATAPNPRVTVSGQATVTVTPPWTVAGCAMPPPSAGNGPCVTATFTTSATRLMSGGVPLLLADSQALCTPTATPLLPVTFQLRATGI